jgi:hypothetical protein
MHPMMPERIHAEISRAAVDRDGRDPIRRHSP